MTFRLRLLFLFSAASLSMLSRGHSFYHQGLTEIAEIVSYSINNKRIGGIANYFDNTVELTINNKHNTYSKDHALILLSDFLNKQNIKNYETNYKGTSINANTLYIIGTAFTPTDSFKVYLFLKYKSPNYTIHEVKIGN